MRFRMPRLAPSSVNRRVEGQQMSDRGVQGGRGERARRSGVAGVVGPRRAGGSGLTGRGRGLAHVRWQMEKARRSCHSPASWGHSGLWWQKTEGRGVRGSGEVRECVCAKKMGGLAPFRSPPPPPPRSKGVALSPLRIKILFYGSGTSWTILHCGGLRGTRDQSRFGLPPPIQSTFSLRIADFAHPEIYGSEVDCQCQNP